MMSKYLIFRTDRVGDFLLSLILINSIKRNDPSSHITLVASKKNYEYIKSFHNIDYVYCYKEGFLNRINLINSLRKIFFDFLILHDDKKRSKFISFFLKFNKKVNFENTLNLTHIKIIQNILNKMDYNLNPDDLNILLNRKYTKVITNDYIVFHYDEKWSNSTYISSYTDIEPNYDDLYYFLNKLSEKTQLNIIVTTGSKTPPLFSKLSNNNINKKIIFLKDQNFLDLENVISKSYLLISCHGAVSHVASALNIKQIDIIETNKNNPYDRWTSHFRNYKSLKRNKFSNLSNQILNNL